MAWKHAFPERLGLSIDKAGEYRLKGEADQHAAAREFCLAKGRPGGNLRPGKRAITWNKLVSLCAFDVAERVGEKKFC